MSEEEIPWWRRRKFNRRDPVKERFGQEEREKTGLQQPSVSSPVKSGAV